jgi:hypothetical protein
MSTISNKLWWTDDGVVGDVGASGSGTSLGFLKGLGGMQKKITRGPENRLIQRGLN